MKVRTEARRSAIVETATELFKENAVFFLEVFDDVLLMPIDPARDGAE